MWLPSSSQSVAGEAHLGAQSKQSRRIDRLDSPEVDDITYTQVGRMTTSAACWQAATGGLRSAAATYAVLTLLARPGLRAGEVAALDLGDIDWRAGELVRPGQGSTPGKAAATR